MGFWDERYIGGGYEDDEFLLKLRGNDLAIYESEESEYEMTWKSPLRSYRKNAFNISQKHFTSKWKLCEERIIQTIEDTDDSCYQQRIYLDQASRIGIYGERPFRPWSHSVLGICWKYRMLTNMSGPPRSAHMTVHGAEPWMSRKVDLL